MERRPGLWPAAGHARVARMRDAHAYPVSGDGLGRADGRDGGVAIGTIAATFQAGESERLRERERGRGGGAGLQPLGFGGTKTWAGGAGWYGKGRWPFRAVAIGTIAATFRAGERERLRERERGRGGGGGPSALGFWWDQNLGRWPRLVWEGPLALSSRGDRDDRRYRRNFNRRSGRGRRGGPARRARRCRDCAGARSRR